MALFFLFAALSPSLRTAGLLFALVLYGCLALWRIGTVLTLDGLGSFPLRDALDRDLVLARCCLAVLPDGLSGLRRGQCEVLGDDLTC